MRPVLIFRHQSKEGPGYFADFLCRREIPFELIRVDAADPVPETPDGAAALVFMGGPMSVNDELPWIEAEVALIRRAAARGVPLLGHCLGGQLIAKALGGRVTAMPEREIGWHPVERVPSPEAEAWLAGLPPRTLAFHWHGESFSLPPDATCILQSEFCPNQAFVLGNILGLQCHVEMTPDMVHEWAEAFGEQLIPSPGVQDRDGLCADLETRVEELRPLADTLYSNWLQGVTG